MSQKIGDVGRAEHENNLIQHRFQNPISASILRRGEKSHEEIFVSINPEIYSPRRRSPMQNPPAPNLRTSACDSFSYRFLLPVYIQMIEEALASLGEYGEVRLIVEKGRLRFLVTQRSYDMLKFRPGSFIKELDISPE